jgi:hypothetical protein
MKTQRLFGTLAIVSFLAACSDGGVGPTEGDPLTELESEAITGELLEGAFSGMFAGLSGQSAQAPSQVPVSFSLDISHVESCEGSGTINLAVAMSGTIDDVTGEGDLALEIVETMNDCVVTVENVAFTVNGNPNITMTGDLTMSGESGSGTFAFDGGFSYTAADGRAGSCGIDVDIVFSPTALSYSGTICNTSVDLEISVGA